MRGAAYARNGRCRNIRCFTGIINRKLRSGKTLVRVWLRVVISYNRRTKHQHTAPAYIAIDHEHHQRMPRGDALTMLWFAQHMLAYGSNRREVLRYARARISAP